MSEYRGYYTKDIDLAQTVAKIMTNGKYDSQAFNNWLNHYHWHLMNMYQNSQEILTALNITYENFVKLAYNCTQEEYNDNSHKYYKPLN